MKKLCLTVCFVALVSCFALGQVEFQFTTFRFPGADATAAYGIADNGRIVGSYRVGSARQAMLIYHGQYFTLAPSSILETSSQAVARGINNRGDIVGSYIDAGIKHGFVLRDGAVTTIDPPGVSRDLNGAFATGINNCGTIVGTFGDTLGVVHGFSLTEREYTRIDAPGAAETNAIGVNCRGEIVGFWDTDLSDIGYAYIRNRSGQLTSFEVPGAPPHSSQANNVNERGDIVGLYIDPIGAFHGFLLVCGTFTIVDVPGAEWTICWGLNNAGQIVGQYRAGGVNSGFLATPLPGKQP
jgi:uncharacterized membrane protein